MGSRFTIPTLAVLAALMAIPAARAADMPLPPPPAEPMLQRLVPARCCRRRHEQRLQSRYLDEPCNSTTISSSIKFDFDTTFFGGGVGYDLNNWLRFDVTGEYRGKTQVQCAAVLSTALGDGRRLSRLH